MIDFLSLQNSTENPTFVTILFTVLLSFFLSSLVAFTYEKTTKEVLTSFDFLQALILVGIVAATVMQAIGDSLARGLGMLGALAIIRFRTNMRAPRNMIFMFASLASGIACGVFGFVIAVTGTIGFCIIAFILRYSPMSQMNNLKGILKFELPKSSATELLEIENILNRFCKKFSQINYKIALPKTPKDVESSPLKVIYYEYHLKLKNDQEGDLLDTALAQIETLKSIKLNFEHTPESI